MCETQNAHWFNENVLSLTSAYHKNEPAHRHGKGVSNYAHSKEWSDIVILRSLFWIHANG